MKKNKDKNVDTTTKKCCSSRINPVGKRRKVIFEVVKTPFLHKTIKKLIL